MWAARYNQHVSQAPRYQLQSPRSFLQLFRDGSAPASVDLDACDTAEAWSLVGLAALARVNGSASLAIHHSSSSPVGRFASAIGLEDAVRGVQPESLGEAGRTVKICRVTNIQEVETIARRIATLMVPDPADDQTENTLRYVLVELMRNAVQHSMDPKGGVVAAQRMDAGYPGYSRPMIQVAVADAGIGILDALRASHRDIDQPSAALVEALRPHVSGKFNRGQTGSAYNAGMGLFFISEMTKLTEGRMLVASRGAALLLKGHQEGYASSTIDFVPPEGSGFPGTLVAFEIPIGEVQDHGALIATIAEKARTRTPARDTAPWLRFEAPPPGTESFVVGSVVEDIEGAERLAEAMQKVLFRRQPVAIDFRGLKVCTQSFLHALLFTVVRMSWALQVPIYVENAHPGVATGIKLVDNYSRGG